MKDSLGDDGGNMGLPPRHLLDIRLQARFKVLTGIFLLLVERYFSVNDFCIRAHTLYRLIYFRQDFGIMEYISGAKE